MECFSQSIIRSKPGANTRFREPRENYRLGSRGQRRISLEGLHGLGYPYRQRCEHIIGEDTSYSGWLGKHQTHWGQDHLGKRRAIPSYWSRPRKALEIS